MVYVQSATFIHNLMIFSIFLCILMYHKGFCKLIMQFQYQNFILFVGVNFNNLPINRTNRKLPIIIYMQKPNQKQSTYLALPKRVKGAEESKFRKIVIESNRFKVDVSKLSWIYIFAIKFTPDLKEQKKSEKLTIINKITPQIKDFIEKPVVKDGLIYTYKQPKISDKTILYQDYIIFIREVKRFNVEKNPQMLLYFLGNVMRKMMDKLQYVEVANTRKFIDLKKFMEVQNVLVYTGFKANFELLQNGYYLTIDTTKKVVRNQSVLDYINFLYKSNDQLQRDQKRQLVRKSLLNRIVMTNYGRARYLKVEDVIFVDLTQVVVQSCKILLPEYYRIRYDINIKTLKQPLLFANPHKTKIKTFLIPQLCLMTGIPQDFDQTKNKTITESSRASAQERKLQIQGFMKQLKKIQQQGIYSDLGVSISTNCEKIQARMIPTPKIILGDNRSVAVGRQSSFSMQDMPIFKIRNVVKLGIITFQNIDSSTIIDFFIKTLTSLKVKVELCIIKTKNTLEKRGMDSIFNYIQMAKQKQNCNLCLIIIPNKMRHFYNKIKQITLIQKQLNCQVVLQGTLKKKHIQSVAMKVLLQILAKSGNTLWATVPVTKKSKIMIVSYYSCQLGKTKTNYYTVGICATCDDLHTEFFSKNSKYGKQHQQLHSMKQLLLEAIAVYKKKNGYLPEDIIILQNQKPARNQSSTIQFLIQPIINVLQQFYGLQRPKLVYIVIRKCLNDRFFRSFQGKCINPPIGTLINNHLTSSKYDFYMISHNICKNGGSIIPLNYKVAFSDSNLQEGIIQALLFSQCFNYANYTGAIRQPATLQYAIKCSKFGAEVLYNVDVSQKMRLYPYYI